MTTDELKDALKELMGMLEQPHREVKESAALFCTARLTAAVEDQDFEVPADILDGVSPLGRKLALVGIILLVNHSLRS